MSQLSEGSWQYEENQELFFTQSQPSDALLSHQSKIGFLVSLQSSLLIPLVPMCSKSTSRTLRWTPKFLSFLHGCSTLTSHTQVPAGMKITHVIL